MRLTSRGGGLLATAGVLAGAGALFGIQECYVLAVVAVVLVLGAALWARFVRWDLAATRSITPERVPAGTDAMVELVVRNRRRKPSPILGLRDRYESERAVMALALGPLQTEEVLRTVYQVPTPRRGIHAIGPLMVQVADPFGLVVVTRLGAPPSPLIVHPRIVDLAVPAANVGAEVDAPESWTMARAIGGEIATVREYRTGDDLRRVHWPSTARLDELMVRQDEAPTDGHLTVAIDLRREAWQAGGMETALSVAASLLLAAFHRGVDARLVTSAGLATEPGGGAAQRTAALDLLAGAQAATVAGQADLLIEACTSGPSILVTTAGQVGRQLLASPALRARSGLTAVLVRPVGAAPVRSVGDATRAHVLLVDSAEELATAWLPDEAKVGP